MEIKDTFRVPLAVEDAWDVLLDVERIAPCLPGAKLEEVEGDEYRGYVKVKLGAVQMQYKGVASFESIDEASRTFVLKAEGREAKGQGRASASITGRLVAAGDGDGTDVSIDTDLKISGRAAQFGRGVLADVSKSLLGQFASCLESKLGSESASTEDVAAEAPEAAQEATTPLSAVAVSAPDDEPEAIDILGVAGAPIAKRAVPLGIAALIVLIVIWRLRRR